MKLLSSLARALVRKDFVESLRNASTPDEVVELVDSVVNPAPAAEAPKPAPAAEPAKEQPKTLVAVTACPTGIAHTYMAADSLVAAAKKAGATLHVETQGSSGSTPLDRRRRSPTPMPSSSPPTSVSRTSTGSPASRS